MSIRDLFLSAEERYHVWCIKVAERPELLDVYGGNDGIFEEEQELQADEKEEKSGLLGATDDDGEHDECGNQQQRQDEKELEEEEPVIALTDGCDLAKWRSHGFVPIGSEMEAVLRVGSGCPLLRRERQLPVIARSHSGADTVFSVLQQALKTKWKRLQERLFVEPLVCPVYNGKSSPIVLKRLEPLVLDYDVDLNPLYPSTGRTYKDSAPQFEIQSLPALIHGCTRDWAAMNTMTWTSLWKRFGQANHDHVEWRFSDTHGVGMTLYTYEKYCNALEGLTDDAPLAIYDSQFHRSDDARNCLVREFSVPTCFQYDIFACLPEEVKEEGAESDEDGDVVCVRPPYQWILMGPERSGTGLHVDPIGTHAWVTLLEGCKRWVLFPPDTPSEVIAYSKSQQLASVVWFEEWWCGGKILGPSKLSNDMDNLQQKVIEYVEFLQKPGETIYVPAGWPHLVLNLETSVAVTQNYATEFPSFQQFWKAVKEEGSLVQQEMLYESLRQSRPDLLAALD